MRCIYLIFLLLASYLPSFGQSTGSVRGSVKTSDGTPAAYVNISVEGSSKGTVADRKGNFEIKNLQAGNYTIVASFIGLETQTQAVAVKPGEAVSVDFVLKESARELEEIVVSGTASLNKEDAFVAKMPLKRLENPQSYSSVSSEILKQQAITNYDDAFRNMPGVFRTWESTGRSGDGAAFFALRGLEGQPALVNGLPGITNGNLDPANIEEIQVMKGPSATLFGANATPYASYGGIINAITKKPYYKTGGEITYNIGSFGLSRMTADFNTPLSQTEKIALRLNAAHHTEGSFQDAGFKKSFFIAPTLAYELNDRLKFLIVAEILQEERAVAPAFFHTERSIALPFKSVEELNLDNNLSFTSNDLSIKNPRTNLQAQMLYKLSEKWNSQTVISRATANSDGYYTYIWPDKDGDNYFGQYFSYAKESRVATDIQQNFNGDFNIGSLRNRLLVGLDYFNQVIVNNSVGDMFIRNVTPQGDVNYIDPDSGEELAPVYLSRASVDSRLSASEPGNSNSMYSAYGAYVSDVLNITPYLTVLAGVRADYFDSKGEKSDPDDNFDQFSLSPKLGLVIQPVVDKLSIFANYQNAFKNVAPVQVADQDGSNPRLKSFEPEQANQWETGVKANLLKDKLFATASYYNIKVSNRVIGDVSNSRNRIQGGEVESKGFEVEVTANLLSGIKLIAGYSHNETKNREGVPDDFYSGPGQVPGGQGPQDQVNFWATYVVAGGSLKDLGFGFGGNYASAYRVVDNVFTGVFDLPSYTVLNAGVFYNPGKFRVAVNVNNLLDTEYYIGYWSVNPQKPRNAVVSLSYKF